MSFVPASSAPHARPLGPGLPGPGSAGAGPSALYSGGQSGLSLAGPYGSVGGVKSGALEIEPLPFEVVQELCTWIDSIELSRPKRCMARDFSDGVLFAELIHFYYPKLVELHNYSAANSLAQKRYNWATLCQKPLRKLRVKPDPALIEAVVEAKPNAIEHLLYQIQPLLLAGDGAGGKGPGKGSRSLSSTGRSRPATLSGVGEIGGGNSGGGRLQAPPVPTNHILNGNAQGNNNMMGSSSLYPMYQAGPTSDTGTIRALQEQITELRDMNGLLEAKVAKLQQLVRLKDERIKALVEKLEEFD